MFDMAPPTSCALENVVPETESSFFLLSKLHNLTSIKGLEGEIIPAMASGTALVYDEEMMSYELLWEDLECEIEVPDRLSVSYNTLKHYGLVERCVPLPIREATEEEITLVHSSEYLEIVKSTQTMSTEELKKTSDNFNAAFFHPNSYRCAKLALGGTLQLVDAVMSGQVRNGLALVRPPGHHSQPKESNGFCVFNNVAIAAKYAKKKYNLQRILIVDWDIHHGQGIQYIFEDDPSVLYFSWHRYEHGSYWPNLDESDYDSVGKGKGMGYNINLPWNQVGMTNADYIAAFFHVLLPMAFEFNPELVLVSAGYDSSIGDPEGHMRATPECFSHLTHLLKHLSAGKLCLALEGGYHLRSLGESVSMTVRTLLGDPVTKLTGEMKPWLSALESIQNARHVHAPYWKCLMHDETTLIQDLSTRGSCSSSPLRTDPSIADRFIENHMKKILHAIPKSTNCVFPPGGHIPSLPSNVEVENRSAPSEIATAALSPKELTKLINWINSILRPVNVFSQEHLGNENMVGSVGRLLAALDKFTIGQTRNCIAVSPFPSLSTQVALQHLLNLGMERVFCVIIGEIDTRHDFPDNGTSLILRISGGSTTKRIDSKYHCFVKWNETTGESSSFFYPLFRFILPLAYSYQPELILLAAGCDRTISNKDILLLTSLLQGVAEGALLALVQESEPELTENLCNILAGCNSGMDFGPFKPPTEECVLNLKEELIAMEEEWKLLKCLARRS